MTNPSRLSKPEWIRTRVPSGGAWNRVRGILSDRRLHTVCDEAKCPNKAECWGCGTATFMIMGDICTRGCRFCAVATAREGRPLEADEPERLASAIDELGLSYAVLTSVDRDDLPDRGAGHFASCLKAIHGRCPSVQVEVLVPDYIGEEIRTVVEAGPVVVAHNIETVRRLQSVRDARASFDRSLLTLSQARAAGAPLTKSSILLGLGETREELIESMKELREAGVDVLVMGQYLQPTPRQVSIVEYVHPDTFAELAGMARQLGFSSVVSAPFARTSYHARAAWETRDVSQASRSEERP